MDLRENIFAGFYFKDGDINRFAEIVIDGKEATIKFHLDGVSVPVDPRRIYIADLPKAG